MTTCCHFPLEIEQKVLLNENGTYGYKCDTSLSNEYHYLCITTSNFTKVSLQEFLNDSINQHESKYVINEGKYLANFRVIQQLPAAEFDKAYVAVVPNNTIVYCAGGQGACKHSQPLNPKTLIIPGKFLTHFSPGKILICP